MANYLGCDVDLTLLRSDRGWLEWLYSKASDKDQEEYSLLFCGLPKQPYNLAEMFPSVQNPMEYWNNLDYDQFEPLEGSVEALERISTYFGIVFISHVEGLHGKTKQKWLKKHYPFLTGTIFTREKFLMNDSVVAMIDDRVSHLQGFDYHKRILFNTAYTQDVECEVYKTLNSWKDVDDKFVQDLLCMRKVE